MFDKAKNNQLEQLVYYKRINAYNIYCQIHTVARFASNFNFAKQIKSANIFH